MLSFCGKIAEKLRYNRLMNVENFGQNAIKQTSLWEGGKFYTRLSTVFAQVLDASSSLAEADFSHLSTEPIIATNYIINKRRIR